jgi:hypothetical protein
MRLFHFCSLGMVQLLLRVALGDLLWKQLSLFTAKVVTHARPVLCRCQKPSRFDYRARGPGQDDGSMRLIKAALGRQKAPDDAHATFASASLSLHCLIMLTQPDFDLLTHPAWEALSQMSTSMLFPCAWICSHSHCRKSVVTPLAGRPDMKRRCMRPQVAESIP